MAYSKPTDDSFGVSVKMKYVPKGNGFVKFKEVSGKDLIAALQDDGAQSGNYTTSVVPDMLTGLMRSRIMSVSSNSSDAGFSKDFGLGIGTDSDRDTALDTIKVVLKNEVSNNFVYMFIPTTVEKKAQIATAAAQKLLAQQLAQRIGVLDASGNLSAASWISVEGVTYIIGIGAGELFEGETLV